ncbi:hypothetical protein RRG08_009304 [Elysia crispata]|uniref:Uncharacterized protein n=1 Tax=Elysia crispata TaxID=231223 RepID=A0AAE1CL07_9GAST|nr:hypothetical protein RRG08_009304 [Elysia crispata]
MSICFCFDEVEARDKRQEKGQDCYNNCDCLDVYHSIERKNIKDNPDNNNNQTRDTEPGETNSLGTVRYPTSYRLIQSPSSRPATVSYSPRALDQLPSHTVPEVKTSYRLIQSPSSRPASVSYSPWCLYSGKALNTSCEVLKLTLKL